MKRKLKKIFSSKLFKVIVIIAIVLAGYKIIVQPKVTQKKVLVQQPLPPKPAKATTEVNKSFEFPAAVVGGKGTEDVTFTIASAELKDEIQVKGELKKANKGSQFLLLRLEIENETTEKLALTPTDYIRLVREGEKKFSPDFHNATVIIDPLSVRRDLVSFIVDNETKSFKFLVGELEEEKETVEVNF